jgi:rhamnulokinase
MSASELPCVVAIDLGAESCRVSVLRWQDGSPRIQLLHRFSNGPIEREGSLYWDLEHVLTELDRGLRLCCDLPHITSIGVDGWAVDYVRLQKDHAVALPFCYRDERNENTFARLQKYTAPHEIFARTGVQPLVFNTMFQLMADADAGLPAQPWVNLPEYVLLTLGGKRVSEFTNATHTGLVDQSQRAWSDDVFSICGLDRTKAPELVATGTDLGQLKGSLSELPVFAKTRLIATACHDTASAVAAIPLDGDDWAYISSGTWSLVGTLLDKPVLSSEAFDAGFTNLGAAGNRICFHRNVNGMWLLKQTMDQLCAGDVWTVSDVVAACDGLMQPALLLDVDEPSFFHPGNMATRINEQLIAHGGQPIAEDVASLPEFANLIFHSLAARYAEVFRDASRLTGKTFQKIAVVGGGSRNAYLNRLTAQATGLEVVCGAAESSTIGNFAVQLATLEGKPNDASRIAYWAHRMVDAEFV